MTGFSSNHSRVELLNMMCRTCAKEDANSISIFGVDGIKHNIVRKIQACLPIDVREDDNLPKQICLTCFTKLDSSWAMFVQSKEAQMKIEKILYLSREKERKELSVVSMSVEDKLRNLTETYPVSYGQSAVICLAPDTTPAQPPAPVANITRDAPVVPPAPATTEPMMPPVTYLAPASANPVQPSAPSEEVYPQALIRVRQDPVPEQPVVYQSPAAPPAPPRPRLAVRRRVPVPKPMPAPVAPQRTAPMPLKRQNGETSTNISGKKLCVYCKKYFTDDIIDHHISLHLRQTFRTCLDCNKNFRSEEALERHRCESSKSGTENETIDLDPDDDELIIV